ncbi:TlpA family protein disulfide reductase [Ideonella sp. YS5]|uniref:TlpA family protein disulfide reductase n=1 Tax=Ideonella sp. YS5 TaxID=3453714 RepID=UPI003EEF0C6C
MKNDRRGTRLLAAVAWALCSVLSLPALALEPGQRAPEINATAAGGQPLRLGSLKGQVVLLDFWASWCGPCKKSFPWMNEMQAKYGPAGLRIVAINLDEQREAADRFLAQVPAKFTVGFDTQGATPGLFGVKGMPSSVLIGANGFIDSVHAGFRDEDAAALEKRIVQALEARR